MKMHVTSERVTSETYHLTVDASEYAAALREAVSALRRDRALRPREKKLATALATAFRAQGAALIARLNAKRHLIEANQSHTVELSGGPVSITVREAIKEFDWLADFDAAALATMQAFKEPLSALITEALALGIRDVLADFSADVSFDVKHKQAQAYIKKHGADLIKDINKTTKSKLANLINKAVGEGWSYARLAKEIRNTFAQFAAGRAEKIATHEIGMAYEQGTLMAAQQMKAMGLSMEKAWLTVKDPKVDGTICGPNEDQGWIPLDDAFQSGHDGPLGHPGCRCTLLTRRAGAAD